MNKSNEAKIAEVIEHLDRIEAVLSLIPAETEPPVRSGEYQEGLQKVEGALAAEGIKISSRMHFEETVGSHAFLLGQFTVDLAKSLGPAIAGAIGGWLAARNGRKARLRIGDVEAEARTPEEVAELLKLAQKYQRSQLGK